MKTIADIQRALKAPKDKTNSFGGYNYRTAEGIIHAYKEVAPEDAELVMSDAITLVGDRIFLVATATLTIEGNTWSATGCAMHAMQKKGMDDAQITGSASSYARKYALAGLFAIDDSDADPDAKDNRGSPEKPEKPEMPERPTTAAVRDDLKARIDAATTHDDLDRLEKAWGGAMHRLETEDEPKALEVRAAMDRKRESL